MGGESGDQDTRQVDFELHEKGAIAGGASERGTAERRDSRRLGRPRHRLAEARLHPSPPSEPHFLTAPRKEDDAYYESLAVQGCYLIQRIANELWPAIRSRSKDYIKKPKPNRYRSLHSVHKIKVPKDRPRDGETRLGASEAKSGGSGKRELKSYPMLEHVLNESLVIDDPATSEEEFFSDDFQPAIDETTFELQIRTNKMDEEAEHGPASHALYKSGFDL